MTTVTLKLQVREFICPAASERHTVMHLELLRPRLGQRSGMTP
jgi:hypothetical protein